MKCALFPIGAGPSLSGIAPPSACSPFSFSRFGTLNLPSLPLHLCTAPAISNRHMMRLEISTTPLESTTSLFLIDPKQALIHTCVYTPLAFFTGIGTIWARQLVEVSAVAHNGIRPLFARMKRSIIFLFAVILALAGLAIGIAKVRPALPHLAKVKPAANAGPSRAPVKPTSAPASAVAKSASTNDPEDGSSADDESRVIRFAAHPQDAPPFMAPDLDGQAVSTAAWKGKVVLLTFWATWCPPCRAEIPMLIKLKDAYKDRLEIVGVSLDDDPAAQVKAFTTNNRFNFPVVMATREIIRDYGGVPALPTTFVINTDGKIVQKHIGLYRTSVYEGEIRALLGLPVDATVETFEDTGQIFLTNASRATELPDVDFTGLTADQKVAALKQLNSITCTCGCKLTLAQCRINDTSCPISKGLAAKIVAQIAAKSSAPAAQETAPTQPSAPAAEPAPQSPAAGPDTTSQQSSKPD